MTAPRLSDVVKGVSECFEQLAGPYEEVIGAYEEVIGAYVSLSLSWRTEGGQLLTFTVSSSDVDDIDRAEDES